jgi:hypothetical protein
MRSTIKHPTVQLPLKRHRCHSILSRSYIVDRYHSFSKLNSSIRAATISSFPRVANFGRDRLLSRSNMRSSSTASTWLKENRFIGIENISWTRNRATHVCVESLNPCLLLGGTAQHEGRPPKVGAIFQYYSALFYYCTSTSPVRKIAFHLTCITKCFNSAIQDFSPSTCQSTALPPETSIAHQPRRRPPLPSPHSTSTRPVHQVNLRIAQASLSSKYHLAANINNEGLLIPGSLL